MMCVPASPHGFNVDERWATSVHGELASNRCRRMPRGGVRPVDGPRRETHRTGFVRPQLNAGLFCRRCIQCNLVVLQNIGDGQTACPGEIHGFPKLSAGGGTFADARDVESVEPLPPPCKGKAGHGGAGDGERGCRRQHAHVPSTNVKVPATCVVPTSVLVRTNLAEVGRHHIQRGIAHRKTKANVPNHWSDDITVVAVAGPSVTRCVRLAS